MLGGLFIEDLYARPQSNKAAFLSSCHLWNLMTPCLLEPFRKELKSRESLVIPWTAPDSEVPHVEAGTSSDGRPARLALRE